MSSSQAPTVANLESVDMCCTYQRPIQLLTKTLFKDQSHTTITLHPAPSPPKRKKNPNLRKQADAIMIVPVAGEPG